MDYNLTQEQEEAFNELASALKKCAELNVYIWSDYGLVSAVNGNIVNDIAPEVTLDEALDEQYVSRIYGYEIHENSDDPLFVEFVRREAE